MTKAHLTLPSDLQKTGVIGGSMSDGNVYAPSAAAIRCYESAGSNRPTENGWRMWKTAEGRTLNELYKQLDHEDEHREPAIQN
jgi:hypothetical protein